MVTTVLSTVAEGMAGGVRLGGAVVFFLLVLLMAYEVATFGGSERLLPLSRALRVAIVPLVVAVICILIQRIGAVA